MNRGTIRTILRRQLKDVPAAQWTNAELDETINVAYANVQKEIRKVFPEAHLFWDYIDTSATVSWYPLPETFGIIRVALKAKASDTSWTKLEKKPYDLVGPDHGTTPLTENYYARKGQWIGIFDAPTASVDDGIQLIHVPVMSMATDDEFPKIKVPTHEAIVLWSRLLLLGETDEGSGETKARLGEILGDLPNWYDTDTDAADKFIVEV